MKLLTILFISALCAFSADPPKREAAPPAIDATHRGDLFKAYAAHNRAVADSNRAAVDLVQAQNAFEKAKAAEEKLKTDKDAAEAKACPAKFSVSLGSDNEPKCVAIPAPAAAAKAPAK